MPGGQWHRARWLDASHSAPEPHAPAHADMQRRDTHASTVPHSESVVHSGVGSSDRLQATIGLPRSGGTHMHWPR